MATVFTADVMYARLKARYSPAKPAHLADLLAAYWADGTQGGADTTTKHPRGAGQWDHMNKKISTGSKHYGDKANAFWQVTP